MHLPRLFSEVPPVPCYAIHGQRQTRHALGSISIAKKKRVRCDAASIPALDSRGSGEYEVCSDEASQASA